MKWRRRARINKREILIEMRKEEDEETQKKEEKQNKYKEHK